MKTMNYALLITFIFFGMGCSNEEEYKTEELKATESRSSLGHEQPLLSEPQVHQLFLEQEFNGLNCQLENILVDVENGIPGSNERLEENQILTEQNRRNSEFIDDAIARIRPCGGRPCPRPRPNPCGDVKDCIFSCPILMFDSGTFISITGNIDIRILNENGEVCGEMVNVEQTDENIFEISIESDGCGDGFLEITKEFEGAEEGEISYRMPITFEY